MISTRSKLKKLGLIGVFLLGALVAIFFARRNTQSISVIYIGMRNTSQGPKHLFEISNSLPYRINWMELDPEFKLESGWTISEPPAIPGARSSPGNPEPLEPGRSYQVVGSPATNVPHRLPVMWEIYYDDAQRRPKWQRVADEWAERKGIRPPFLPHGIQRGPVIPPTSLAEVTGANVAVGSKEFHTGTAAHVVDREATTPSSIALAHGGASPLQIVFEGPTSMEGWTQGPARTPNRGPSPWNYTNGALVATGLGSIARNVPLPAVASVDFDLAWSNSLHLAVALYADSLQPLDLTSEDNSQVGGVYSLQFNGDMADLFAVRPGKSVNSLGMVMVPGLRDKATIHVTLRIHKPDRRVWLLLDNTLIKQWETGQEALGNGTCLRFVNAGLSRLEISKLVVSEWDEKTTAPINISPGSQ